MEIKLIKISILKPHEEINEKRLQELHEKFLNEKMIDYPIIVDKNTFTILDGDHRYFILKNLKITKIPALLVDYFSDNIKITSWRKGEKVSKDLVIEITKNKKLLPPKTTKHIYDFEIPSINYPLNLKIGK